MSIAYHDWKKGDKLKCVKPDNSFITKLTQNAIYTFNRLGGDDLVWVDEVTSASFWYWRFEYLGPAKKQIVLSEELSAKVIKLVSIVHRETNSQSELDDAKAVLEELTKNDAPK